ncbi:hypothetical protein SNE40_006537 [Patella caerulea]|uniref:Uncharacterized protein n=1 Tax=Patella caerulea TaxID=87958 RepID=A0AAN8JWD9_PATCE
MLCIILIYLGFFKDAVVTTTESVEGGTDTGDAVSILLVSIGVVAGLCITSVVAGIFYLKFTKNNVVDLQKKTKRSKTKKKRKAPEVRELSDYPAFTPPRSVLYPITKTPLGKGSELTMVDA